MTVKYGGKEYVLSFNNWKLHQYAEACGFETLEEAFNSFGGFAEVANGASLTISQSKHLGHLCAIVIEDELSLEDSINLIYSEVGLIGDCLGVALDALPKPREEDEKKKLKVAQ